MKTKKKIIIIISLLLSITLILSLGYLIYKQIGEPAAKEEKYTELREAYKNGELDFNKNTSSTDESSELNNEDSKESIDSEETNSENADDSTVDSNVNTNEPAIIINDGEPETYTYTYVDRMIGWISIPGTNIDYPVMYYENNNEFYLTHDFQNNYDSYGSIFLNGSQWVDAKNMTLFGHNINAYYRSMFKEILNFENKDYFDSHPVVDFDIGSGSSEWEVIGCLVIDVTKDTHSFDRCVFNNDEEFIDFTNELLDNCKVKKDGVEISGDDQLLTLATCSYHYKNGRTVLICRRVK